MADMNQLALCLLLMSGIVCNEVSWQNTILLPDVHAPSGVKVDDGILHITENLENVSVAMLSFSGSEIPEIRCIVGTPNGAELPKSLFTILHNGTLILNNALEYDESDDKAFIIFMNLGNTSEKMITFKIVQGADGHTTDTLPDEQKNLNMDNNQNQNLQFNTWAMSVAENQYNSANIREAVDKTHSGGELCYCMSDEDADMFLLSNTTLSNKFRFDRERKDHYQVTIVASNKCPTYDVDGLCTEKHLNTGQNVLIVNVTVLDENDETPYFITKEYFGAYYAKLRFYYADDVYIQAFDSDVDDTLTYKIYKNEVTLHKIPYCPSNGEGPCYLNNVTLKLPDNTTNLSMRTIRSGVSPIELPLDHQTLPRHMQGYLYYSFRIVAYDQVGHASNWTRVKVFNFNGKNLIQLCFNTGRRRRPTGEPDPEMEETITSILSQVFEYTCVVQHKIENYYANTGYIIFFINLHANATVDADHIMAKYTDPRVSQVLMDMFDQHNLNSASLSIVEGYFHAISGLALSSCE